MEPIKQSQTMEYCLNANSYLVHELMKYRLQKCKITPKSKKTMKV